jgi:hypothetical protein
MIVVGGRRLALALCKSRAYICVKYSTHCGRKGAGNAVTPATPDLGQ